MISPRRITSSDPGATMPEPEGPGIAGRGYVLLGGFGD
jgi:hypothetical protein